MHVQFVLKEKHLDKYVSLENYLQDTAGDVRGYLSMRCVLYVFVLRGEVMFQTRLPQPHQRRAVPLNGACLPYGRGDARYANLHHRLVVVIGQIVLPARTQ